MIDDQNACRGEQISSHCVEMQLETSSQQLFDGRPIRPDTTGCFRPQASNPCSRYRHLRRQTRKEDTRNAPADPEQQNHSKDADCPANDLCAVVNREAVGGREERTAVLFPNEKWKG